MTCPQCNISFPLKPTYKQFKDLEGQRFGRLIAYGVVGRNKLGQPIWHCHCDCGNTLDTGWAGLFRGNTTSCRCWSREKAAARCYIHGHHNTPTLNTYKAMTQRCLNPNNKRWARYGGRGITICDRWKESFLNFLADMGEKPDGLTLDRIDNNGNYEPGNCRWATKKEQANNKSNVRSVEYQGITKSTKDWCRELNLIYGRVLQRLQAGWSVEDAFFKPSQR